MLVLGLHTCFELASPRQATPDPSMRNSSAALLRDGELLAATQQERSDRIKASGAFPVEAIRCCLSAAEIGMADVDIIVTDFAADTIEERLLYQCLEDAALPRLSVEDWFRGLFAHHFDEDVGGRMRFCSHQPAHILSTLCMSGDGPALCVSLDGRNGETNGQVAVFDGDGLTTLRTFGAEHSVGAFNDCLMAALGVAYFEEDDAAAMAPYGDRSVYASLVGGMYRLLPEGRFTLVSEGERVLALMEAGFGPLIRRKGEPFTQPHKDLAAALQDALERIVLHVLAHFRATTGVRRLCLSGGVAHNCSMNGQILRAGLFDEIYVQPAAHDAGNALGAALSVLREHRRPVQANLARHMYLGRDIGTPAQIARRLQDWRAHITATSLDDASETAAALLAAGLVIGWAQGRSEFGPRALGNRSILADPRPAENKQIINQMVKKREGYRPFAPSVLLPQLREYFEVPDTVMEVPFMNVVLPVRPEKRALLGAVTHVDGSARVQSVARADNPRYYDLIAAFGRHTGVPIVLNTSFNNNAEPIVDSLDDAIVCFLTTGIDRLIVGDVLVEKSAAPPASWLDLVPRLPQSRKLVRRAGADGGPRYALESTANGYFVEREIGISAAVFDLLREDAAAAPARRRPSCPLDQPGQTMIGQELFALWQDRAIQLLPA